MYLKRLEIQGFKTFASRTIIEFRPGITAVVGPNGSGKSNLADAVRWALGEQSLAALRSKRSEELIYSGGGRRTAAGFAEVALTIDNSDRLLPLDFDEVTIARRATRSGDSDYFINRAKVRLRDVQEATEPLGGSYTIINQGLVDAALTLRPEERRRLFEDAAEIGGFETRKAEALRRLRETDSNLQRLGDLLGELEPRLRSLKRQAGQARQHRELSTELRELQLRHYAQLWQVAKAQTERLRTEANSLETALDQVRATQRSASQTLRELRDALRSRRDKLGELHQQSSDLHRRAEAAQRELAVDAERLAALTRRAEELERRRNELELQRANAEAQRESAHAELAQAVELLDAQRESLRSAEQAIAATEAERQALARELRAAQEAQLKANAHLSEQTNRITQIATQRSRLQRDQSELEAAIAQADSRLAGAQAQVAQARQELEQADTARQSLAQEEQRLRGELDVLRASRASADDERAAARRALADVEARFDSLNRLARSYAGTFAGVKAALQWAERTKRAGFVMVQSLLRTPAELETAIEVALGSRLQHIVVERWADAEEAIADLKRSGAGRATFLPIDTIRQGDSPRRSHSNNAQVLGIAAELVDFDPHYAAIVQQLLGRVLLVRDLPTARAELARLSGGWQIVTLGGEQLSSGGALTGGAQTKESGALRRERELRELPAQVEQARSSVAAAEVKRVELEQQLTQGSQSLREAEQCLRDLSRQLETRRSGLDGAQRRVAQAEQERGWSASRREQLAHDLAELDIQEQATLAKQASAEAGLREAETAMAALRTRQESQAQADRLAQERVAGQRAALGAADGQVRAQRTLLAAHERNLEESQRQLQILSETVTGLGTERERIDQSHARAEAEHRTLLGEIDTLRAQIDPAELELKAEEQRQSAIEQQEAEATRALLDQEAGHGRAVLEAQRAADRQESLFERAVADQIDLDSPEAQAISLAEQPNSQQLQGEIEALKGKILRLGTVNPLALEEFDEASERQRFLTEQLSDLRSAEATLLELINDLESAMSQRFSRTFQAVAVEFERSFTQLFGGGSAKLQLTGNQEPGEEENAEAAPAGRSQGIEISVRPPGKKQQSISLLSGGERTLTAAALLLAILKVNPSPFCILDETDAALDESNVGRFREALQGLSSQTQFILITHNRGTIEAADTLYGVTMGDDGASKTISLRVEEFVNSES